MYILYILLSITDVFVFNFLSPTSHLRSNSAVRYERRPISYEIV